MSETLAAENRSVLAYHGRSFRWGGAFLPGQVLNECALIYAFCRLVDDLADEATSVEAAKLALSQVEAELAGESPRPLIRDFRKLFLDSQNAEPLKPAFELIEGVKSDLGPVRIANNLDLLRYCYLVAGTVGLMMCRPLGVRDPGALKYAVSLGMAMQLTNICRDVGEDLERDRIYLPRNLLEAHGLSEAKLREQDVSTAVESVLVLADQYYDEGLAGLSFIPWRQRLAIVVAANLYREIGRQIRRENYPVLKRRVFVAWPRKTWVVLKSLFGFVRTML